MAVGGAIEFNVTMSVMAGEGGWFLMWAASSKDVDECGSARHMNPCLCKGCESVVNLPVVS